MNKSNNQPHFWRRIKRTLKNPFLYIFILIGIIICAATYVVYKTETKTDSGITGMFDAVWHTIVAVVAAYYDFYVKSVPGRFASLLLLLLGMAVWAVIIGKITSVIMNIQNKNNRGLKKIRPMKGHFLLCGWRSGFEKLLENVLSANPDITPDMIVLVNSAPSEQVLSILQDIRFKEIKYVSGDFSDAETLHRAGIETAGRVLVIADFTGGTTAMEIDSRTVLAVLTMKSIKPQVYVAAELLDEKLQEHLQMARCNEIILTQSYEHSLLATASSGMGYSNVIKTLIGDDDNTGILIRSLPSAFVGKPYGDLESYYDKKDGKMILVGLLLNTDANRLLKKDESNQQLEKYNEPLLTPPSDFVIPKSSKVILIAGSEGA
ncbi:MAG: NAD-binding protein [Treponema sp.]|nr:NAD-binding protein [Treponema sp.]MBR3548907.1 NAD-binding protein [Treponema sp.]